MQTKSGKHLHPIGIGTWKIAGTFNSDPTALYKGAEPAYGNEPQEIEAIKYSLSKGQNHIDCGELYGGFYTDEVVGQALKGEIREDLYISDKLWKSSVGVGKVRQTVQEMLSKLQTSYLDMLYIHAPWDDAPWREAIPQIDELIDEGLVRQFGVSNFNIEQMKQAMGLSKHHVVANQMNYNVLYKDEVSGDFLSFCTDNEIALVAYQPVKRQEVFANETIKAIALVHNVSAAQVALAWLIAMGTLPIPKALQHSHIDENIATVELVLSTNELKQLSAL